MQVGITLGDVSLRNVPQGSVAAELACRGEGDTMQLSVEHPTGEFTVELRFQDGRLTRCGLMRTARLLMDGVVFVPDPGPPLERTW